MGTFGLSYTGPLFLLCMFIPNIAYIRNRPADEAPVSENRTLLLLERAGQVLCTACLLVFRDYDFYEGGLRALWFAASALLMLLYLACWVRYFAAKHTAYDFYRPFLRVPLPLASLPVAAVFLLSVYGRVFLLTGSAIILGIGHIGITAQHWNAVKKRG